jgi:malonyl-CoA O-methyltransferase
MSLSLWSRLKKRFRAGPPMLNSLAAYALWAESYPPFAHNRLMEIEQAAMLRLLPPLAGRSVLDLACGTGRYGRIATERGAARVVGVDNSAAMLGRLRAENGPNAVQASMLRLPFASASFDVIVCGLATGHLPPAAMWATFLEMARILHSGGEAILSDFHPALATRGGKRTFTAPDGTLYAVEHYPHLLDDYRRAISSAGMNVVVVEEAQAEINGSRVPAVLVIRCRRDQAAISF